MFDRLPRVDQSPDRNDNFPLALADTSGADYLVAGDKSVSDTGCRAQRLPHGLRPGAQRRPRQRAQRAPE